MCLAIPGRITRIEGDLADVDFGGGTKRRVNISLIDAKVGQYIIVHAGFAIEVLDVEAAEETLQLWEEMLELSGAR
ncbi:MAG: HypC/HybG/HupF family hydrogenase formation chaperone [Candidatus Bathyarchaeia archaeon]